MASSDTWRTFSSLLPCALFARYKAVQCLGDGTQATEVLSKSSLKFKLLSTIMMIIIIISPLQDYC
jgi:hypothetical protein